MMKRSVCFAVVYGLVLAGLTVAMTGCANIKNLVNWKEVDKDFRGEMAGWLDDLLVVTPDDPAEPSSVVPSEFPDKRIIIKYSREHGAGWVCVVFPWADGLADQGRIEIVLADGSVWDTGPFAGVYVHETTGRCPTFRSGSGQNLSEGTILTGRKARLILNDGTKIEWDIPPTSNNGVCEYWKDGVTRKR